MQIAIRWLCSSLLILGALACGSEPEKPCSSADKAAGRCHQTTATAAPALPPGRVLPDWALQLCKDWQRPDGTCDQMQIMADYEECLRTQGVPEQDRLIAQGVRNRAVQIARERSTNLCVELRHWVMTPEGRARALVNSH